MRRLFLMSALVLGCPGVAAAQHHAPIPHATAALRRLGHHPVPFIGMRYSNVQGLTGSLLLLREAPNQVDEYAGAFGAVEAGVHGISAGIGTGRWSALSGGSLRATWLRTWGDGGSLAKGQSFVGGEARVSFWWFSFGAGWYRRVAGTAPGDRSRFTFTAGLGY